MIHCELRQARKGATVAIDSCAGMWLVGLPPSFYQSSLPQKHAISAFKNGHIKYYASIFCLELARFGGNLN